MPEIQTLSDRAMRRLSRTLIMALVVSIIGTRVVDGALGAWAAAGVIAFMWLATQETLTEIGSLTTPLWGRAVSKLDPAKLLATSDLAEAAVSGVALAAIFLTPQHTTSILVSYVLVCTIFPVITDLAEELIAYGLSQRNVDESIIFNARIMSLLGFVGLVIATPVGAFLTVLDVKVVLVVNLILSATGGLLRRNAATVCDFPRPGAAAIESPLGSTAPIATWLTWCFRGGLASPLYSLASAISGGVLGVFLYTWLATDAGLSRGIALGIVIAGFGLGATIGPLLGAFLRKHLSPEVGILCALGSHIAVTISLAVLQAPPALWLGAAAAFLLAVASRWRALFGNVIRQTRYQGPAYIGIASWHFAFSALGFIVGAWLAVVFSVPADPTVGLWLSAAIQGLMLVSALQLLYHQHRKTRAATTH